MACPGCPRRSAPVVATIGLVIVALLASACASDDGRELRPPTEPTPVPSTVAPTTPAPADPITAAPAAGDDDALPGEFPEPGPDDVPVDPPPEFEVFAAWRDGAEISPRHTCEGADVSPALTWTGVPDGTLEVAITVIDEQAAGFVHWVVTGIDPSAVSMLEGELPPGAVEHGNGFGDIGWAGPCPPEGAAHTYRFSVHALDQRLTGVGDEEPSAAVALIEGLALASTTVTGTFSR